MNKPFFTLITPVYNIERLISKTIDSALEQTFSDWEMILIDDGSPDNAGNICDEYSRRDSRIKVIHKANAGLAAARNTGIDASNGEYFWIYEGSDLFVDSHTLQQVHDDIKGQEIDIYFARLQDMMEKGWKVTSVQDNYCIDGVWEGDGRSLFIRLYDHDDILALSSPVNKVFRTAFVKDNCLRFYEGIYHDDDEWIPRAITLSKKCLFTDRIIYNALTWDGCFGGMVSDASRVKKACDKMLIAEHCCNDIDKRFTERGTEFKKKYYEYYVRMYLDGVAALNEVHDLKMKGKIINSIKEHKNVWHYMGECFSRNLRALSTLSKIIGLDGATKVVCRRYQK